jgi:hypothetical protein
MAGKVDIINLALGRLSQSPIGDIAENSVQANVANRVWEICLKDCLRSNNWSFAQVTDNLALVPFTPASWVYAYAYPSNAVVIWKIFNQYTADNAGERFTEGFSIDTNQKILLTNCSNAIVIYTHYLQDATQFDSNFVNILGYRLAAEMAMPLNADPELAKAMTALYVTQSSEAQRMSSYESDALYKRDVSPYVDARGSGTPQQTQPIGGPGGVNFVQWNLGA